MFRPVTPTNSVEQCSRARIHPKKQGASVWFGMYRGGEVPVRCTAYPPKIKPQKCPVSRSYGSVIMKKMNGPAGCAGLVGMNIKPEISEGDLSRIIEMAWEDRTPFEAIEFQFGLKENDVRALMRTHMKASSFRMWRKRVGGRSTKHRKLRPADVNRFKAPGQK